MKGALSPRWGVTANLRETTQTNTGSAPKCNEDEESVARRGQWRQSASLDKGLDAVPRGAYTPESVRGALRREGELVGTFRRTR